MDLMGLSMGYVLLSIQLEFPHGSISLRMSRHGKHPDRTVWRGGDSLWGSSRDCVRSSILMIRLVHRAPICGMPGGDWHRRVWTIEWWRLRLWRLLNCMGSVRKSMDAYAALRTCTAQVGHRHLMRQRWQGLGMAGGILMGRPFRHEVCRRNECAQFELTQFSGDATYGCSQFGADLHLPYSAWHAAGTLRNPAQQGQGICSAYRVVYAAITRAVCGSDKCSASRHVGERGHRH